jgi:hypothetical protein
MSIKASTNHGIRAGFEIIASLANPHHVAFYIANVLFLKSN